jgi:hypothetical protein
VCVRTLFHTLRAQMASVSVRAPTALVTQAMTTRQLRVEGGGDYVVLTRACVCVRALITCSSQLAQSGGALSQGVGMGEGEGQKDVTDQIEDQVCARSCATPVLRAWSHCVAYL